MGAMHDQSCFQFLPVCLRGAWARARGRSAARQTGPGLVSSFRVVVHGAAQWRGSLHVTVSCQCLCLAPLLTSSSSSSARPPARPPLSSRRTLLLGQTHSTRDVMEIFPLW